MCGSNTRPVLFLTIKKGGIQGKIAAHRQEGYAIDHDWKLR
jgi:hypothetical protein